MIKVKILFICCLLFFLSCSLAKEINTDTTTIVAGTSKIKGRIITPDGFNKNSITMTISVINPIYEDTNLVNAEFVVIWDPDGEMAHSATVSYDDLGNPIISDKSNHGSFSTFTNFEDFLAERSDNALG